MFCKDKYKAEDILQETFISIYENAGSYTIFKNPKAWIYTIAKNKAINLIKKDSRTTSIDSPENSEIIQNNYTENTENNIINKMHMDLLFSVLSEKDKKIVILHAVYGFKHREIAELLDIPLGTIKRRYKESIDKMKKKDKESENIPPESDKHNEVIINEKQ